jgi:3-oxoacyl-[acyl-carrier protein] reductase
MTTTTMSSQTSPPTLALQGKVAIVTGASRGIGARLALELARRGAKVRFAGPITPNRSLPVSQVTLVYTSSKSGDKVKQVAADISVLGNGSEACIVQADLAKIEAPEQIVAATREAFGDKIDILVNNAGVLWATPIEQMTPEDYAGIFDVNVRAPFLLIKAVVPHLRKPGRIINMSSIGAHIGPATLSVYAASKAAIEGMTKSLAHELGDAGHTVNAVAPGPVETEMLEGVPQDLVAMQLKLTAVEHRVGTGDDIAGIVAFLASEDSKWVSGQTISASGGFLML